MNRIHVLDCTLRDGGYCNQWTFGNENIRKIIDGLVEANIDIIECGFLTQKTKYNINASKYDKIERIGKVIDKNCKGKMYVAMINYGEYNIEDIPEFDGTSIDGIRVAFHKEEAKEAIDFCNEVKKKGYKVFVQAMVSLCYTDEEFLSLIRRINEVEPYAFYIVDSFGMMKQKDLIRLFYVIEHNLNKEIWLGFHSHNNMQLAYSNAQALVGVGTNRNLIIDCSVYGMGRGAGNLNTELFIEYLNDNYNKKYYLNPLLVIIDEILNEFYQKNYWGYSLPNYISAVYNAHPNYASYLDDKKTLTIEGINEIFKLIDESKKYSFDRGYIENLYSMYMGLRTVHSSKETDIRNVLKGKTIVLIAPGKSSVEQRVRICDSQTKNVVFISVNHDYRYLDSDYIFISNTRRFKELEDEKKGKCIVTSNIVADKFLFQIPYKDFVNGEDAVRDNAGLMAIKFLIENEVNEILLAGFDGYSYNVDDNYANDQLAFMSKKQVLNALNEGMKKVIREYAQEVKISFLTDQKYISL